MGELNFFFLTTSDFWQSSLNMLPFLWWFAMPVGHKPGFRTCTHSFEALSSVSWALCSSLHQHWPRFRGGPDVWQTQASLLALQNFSRLLLDLYSIWVSESLYQVLRKSCWNLDEDYIYFITSFLETSHYNPEPLHPWEDLSVAGFCVASRKFDSFLLRVVISIVNGTFKSITCFKYSLGVYGYACPWLCLVKRNSAQLLLKWLVILDSPGVFHVDSGSLHGWHKSYLFFLNVYNFVFLV